MASSVPNPNSNATPLQWNTKGPSGPGPATTTQSVRKEIEQLLQKGHGLLDRSGSHSSGVERATAFTNEAQARTLLLVLDQLEQLNHRLGKLESRLGPLSPTPSSPAATARDATEPDQLLFGRRRRGSSSGSQPPTNTMADEAALRDEAANLNIIGLSQTEAVERLAADSNLDRETIAEIVSDVYPQW